jgi:hypothetical protein
VQLEHLHVNTGRFQPPEGEPSAWLLRYGEQNYNRTDKWKGWDRNMGKRRERDKDTKEIKKKRNTLFSVSSLTSYMLVVSIVT